MAEAAPDLRRDEELPRSFGRFTLLQVLGTGGMGRVYLAWLEGADSFRKMVAVKILSDRPRDADNEAVVFASIRNEARIGALLRHPGITEVYDYGVQDGVPWISMEVVDGVDLEMITRRCAPLPPGTVIDLGMQLCSALDYAHDFSDGEVKVHLVHRDLKPANVLVDRFGRVKITDFGIARSTLSTGITTISGVLKGTPTFMAPEQVLGRTLDARTDLFAVGAILYEATTGKRLLRRDDVGATVAAVLAVDELIEVGGGFDKVDSYLPGLARVLRGCLAKDPDKRYANAAELGEALYGLLVDQPGLLSRPREGLGAFVTKIAGEKRWARSTEDAEPAAVPGGATDLLGGRGVTRVGTGTELSPAPDSVLVARGLGSSGVRLRALARWLPPVRARGPMAVVVVALAVLAGVSGSLGTTETDDPLREPALFDPVVMEVSRPVTGPAADTEGAEPGPEDGERAGQGPPGAASAARPPGPVEAETFGAVAALAGPEADVGAVPAAEATSAPGEVRSQAVHRRVIKTMAASTARSFIIEAQGLDLAHVRMFFRAGNEEAWGHRALSEVAAGYWGVVIELDDHGARAAEYWFEVQPREGASYVLDDGGKPWLVEILPR